MNENKVIPVKVALRIRPLVPREEADACAECLRTCRRSATSKEKKNLILT